MKIVHVTPAVFGPGQRGGGERYVSELVKALIEQGEDVETLLVQGYRSFSTQAVPYGRVAPSNAAAIFKTLRSADLVHVHQLNSVGFDLVALLKPAMRYRVVVTDHGGGMLAAGRILGSARFGAIDGGAFVSEWSVRDTGARGKLHHLRILYGGGDHLRVAGPLDRRWDFVFVGRMLPHKGPHLLLDALPHGKSALLIGEERDPSYYRHLRALAVGKDVSFVSDANDDYVGAALSSAGALVLPSVTRFNNRIFARPELLGLVALEALSRGLPVIGSDVGGLGELLQKAGQQIFRDGDAEGLRALLTGRLVSPAPEIRRRFTWDHVAIECRALYSEVYSKTR